MDIVIPLSSFRFWADWPVGWAYFNELKQPARQLHIIWCPTVVVPFSHHEDWVMLSIHSFKHHPSVNALTVTRTREGKGGYGMWTARGTGATPQPYLPGVAPPPKLVKRSKSSGALDARSVGLRASPSIGLVNINEINKQKEQVYNVYMYKHIYIYVCIRYTYLFLYKHISVSVCMANIANGDGCRDIRSVH